MRTVFFFLALITATHPVIAWKSVLPTRNRADFPIPGAKEEFSRTVPYIRGLAAGYGKAPEAFVRLISPYAPLSLKVGNATPRQAGNMATYQLGLVGAVFGLPAHKFTNAYHCGSMCTSQRKKALVRKLSGIKAVTRKVQAVENLELIAHWGIPGQYRVNDVFHMLGRTKRAEPSRRFRFLPSGLWREYVSVDAYLSEIKIEPATLRTLINELRGLPLVAIRDMGSVVVAIGSGLGDNESGLWFSAEPPKIGTSAPSGGEFAIVHEVDDGVWYYETS